MANSKVLEEALPRKGTSCPQRSYAFITTLQGKMGHRGTFLQHDYFISFLKIYLLESMPVCMRAVGGAESKGERESPADSPLSMEPNAGLDLTTLRL